MPLVTLDQKGRVPVARGDIVVVIPVFGAHEMFVQCLHAALAHTSCEVPVLVMDDASPDDRSQALVHELADSGALRHRLHYVRHDRNLGFVANLNNALDRCAPADVVVLNSDCRVTAGWLEAMRGAAEDSLVATVSVFTNHETIISLPDRNRPHPSLPQTLDPDLAAEAIATHSPRLRPRLPTAIGHCFLIKRSAIELVGRFDTAFSTGYGEEVDFSQRCVQRGLVHVLADDAFVAHLGQSSLTPAAREVQAEHEQMLLVRYPYYPSWVDSCATSTTSTLAHSINLAQRTLLGLSVTIDARCLTPIITGTQIHTLEVITSLHTHTDIRLRVVVPPDLGDYARALLGGLGSIDLVGDDAARHSEPTDVAHRPMQLSSLDDLELLTALGNRIVVTHQDLIGYHNPAYFRSFGAWEAYRELTRLALASVDRVVFFSHSSAREALREQLVSNDRADVVYIGTDHMLSELRISHERPGGVERLQGRPFLLCLGTDYMHKNRPFALRVLAALRRRDGWDGGLVFAGPHVPVGSSAPEEARLRIADPWLDERLIDLAAVSEGAKRWLLANASAMFYPSVHEGFGLVPFEAAEAGLPCAYAAHTSIAEILPTKLAVIEQWNPDVTADRLAPLLVDGELRAANVNGIRAAAARFTWRTSAHGLQEVYESAARMPPNEARRLARDLAKAKSSLHALETEFAGLDASWIREAMPLVGPNGLVPKDLYRPLMAVASRPVLRKPMWGMLRAMYTAGYRARRRGQDPA